MLRKIRREIAKGIERSAYAIDPDRRRVKADFHLHEFRSYEEYKRIQVHHNRCKIDRVWADARTLDRVAERVEAEFGTGVAEGLCHGTRNGFEQAHLRERLGTDVVGTDISDTATTFPHTFEWDFHDVNEEWVGRFHFLYSNSLDQGWKPRAALETWLGQLRPGGLLFIEHTDAHGPGGASEMDPFGVRPRFMPYVLADWFGHRISVEIMEGTKAGKEMPVWLFVVKKLA